MIEMIKVVKSKMNFVELCLIISPFLDLLTSIGINEFNSNATIGMLIRTIIIAVLLLYFIKNNLKKKKEIIIYFTILFSFFCMHIINSYFSKEIFSLFFEVKNFIKIFYFPVSFVLLISYLENRKMEKKYIFYCGIIYILFLFFPYILGISYDTYSNGKKGSIGLFYSPNEIGAILGILIPFVLMYIYKFKNIKKHIIIHFICIFSMMSIGTKVPFLAIVVFAIMYMLVLIIRRKIDREKFEKKYFIQVLATLVISLILMVTISPLGQNMRWQLEWFDKHYKEDVKNNTDEQNNVKPDKGEDNTQNDVLNVDEDNISNEAPNVNEDNISDSLISNDKKTINSKFDKIMNLLFSSRNIYVKKYMKNWNNSTLNNKLLGFGYSKSNVLEQNIVEIDYFDVFYNYGVLGFIIYFVPLLLLIIRFGSYIIHNFIEFINNDDMCTYFMSICLSFVIALFAGHLFITPAPSFILAIIISTLYIDIKVHMNKI